MATQWEGRITVSIVFEETYDFGPLLFAQWHAPNAMEAEHIAKSLFASSFIDKSKGTLVGDLMLNLKTDIWEPERT